MDRSSSLPEDEPLDPSPPENATGAGDGTETNRPTPADKIRRQLEDLTTKTDELEQRVNEVDGYYAGKAKGNNPKGVSASKEKFLVRSSSTNNVTNLGCSSGGGGAKKVGDGVRKEFVISRRMQEVMRQFGTILRQISQHKWAWPFMQPVDVEGLHLDDYYEVIKKPMDFTTIRNQMEANAYRDAREIYADARLVFTNAMTYNEDKSDVHVMAKTLREKLEEKWLQLLPKVVEAEARQKEEEAQAMANMQMAQEAAIAKMARDTNNELNELNLHLEELRELVVHRCGKMSTEEKRKLGVGLSSLTAQDLSKALEIIAQNNPNFQATAEVVDLDMDAQSEVTLWRLKFFVKNALELQAQNTAKKADDILKRKVIYDALAKTAGKKTKKPGS